MTLQKHAVNREHDNTLVPANKIKIGWCNSFKAENRRGRDSAQNIHFLHQSCFTRFYMKGHNTSRTIPHLSRPVRAHARAHTHTYTHRHTHTHKHTHTHTHTHTYTHARTYACTHARTHTHGTHARTTHTHLTHVHLKHISQLLSLSVCLPPLSPHIKV